MLLNVRLANFLSFEEPAHLCMVSSSKFKNPANHVFFSEEKDIKVLKYAEIFGPNASGKSNLIKFFPVLQTILRFGLDWKMNRDYCQSNQSNREKPSSFEIQFLINENVYSYGFDIVFSKGQILEEYLTIDNKSKRIVLFHRNKEKIEFDSNWFSSDLTRLNIYRNDFKCDSSSLFLRFLNDKKLFELDSRLYSFFEVYNYILNDIVVINPDSTTNFTPYDLHMDGLSKTLSQYLEYFDTGVSAIKVHTLGRKDLLDVMGSEMLEKVESDVSAGDKCVTLRNAENIFGVDYDPKNGQFNYETIRFKHNDDCWLNFGEESDGTIRLFDLFPLVFSEFGNESKIYVVDELDRSLHTKTVEAFLKLFFELNKNSKNQLLFSTHDVNLMDQGLFRQDEMWLIERDKYGVSHLYSIDRFNERTDIKIQNRYLQNRYGALPIFKGSYIK